jgi:hypothetical protein
MCWSEELKLFNYETPWILLCLDMIFKLYHDIRPISKRKRHFYGTKHIVYMCVWTCFEYLNKLVSFHEILFEADDLGGHLKTIYLILSPTIAAV